MSKMSRSEAGKLGAEKTRLLWLERYSKNKSFCACCNLELPYDKRHNKFCNHSCSASFNNKLKGENKKDQICEWCETTIENGKNLQKFCSKKCWGEHKRHQTKIKIESGECIKTRTCKQYLLETRGIQCEICKITEWCGKSVPLVMDHVDGNSENNLISNLRLVCGNCDMQLPTYKNKNKGNGRALRRKRYADGKSY